jgi:hypothetical protein
MGRKNEQTALAVISPEDEQNALSVLDDFEFGGDDGLGEVDAEDLRLPVIVWNLKGKDERGELRRLDEFYDTLNETSHRTLRCAFIHLHKTNSFARFDNATNETVIVCSSNDRITARMRAKHPTLPLDVGDERACEGCPDKDWHKDEKGKNTQNCATVYGVFAVMLDEQLRPTDGFLIRFKRTSLPPFKTHLQKHHLGKRALPGGKRGNWPMFTFEVNLRLEVSANGNYATPIIERGRVLPKETLQALAEQAKYFAELGEEATAAAEKQEARHERGDVGGSGGQELRGDDFAD